MQWINTRVSELKESATLAVMARATRLKAQGNSIVDMSTGEPDIDVPEHIKEGAIKAMRDRKNRYTPPAGIIELREALAEKFTRDSKIKTEAPSVIVTNGGKQALYEVFDVVLEPGDEVLIPAPFWVSFPAMVQLSGGVSVIVPTRAEDGYRMTAAALAAKITPKTKALVFNSPSNPCGVAYSVDEVKAIAEVLRVHKNILIIADEVYEKITYDGFQFESFAAIAPDLADRTVTVNAFSKSYSMTGWRVGYSTGPREIIAAMIRHQSQTTSNINSVAQYAALAALRGDHQFQRDMVANFDARIGRVMQAVSKMEGIDIPSKPQGAFYLFVRIEELLKRDPKRFAGSTDVANFLLEEVGLAVVPGEAFGDDGAFRISVGSADDVIEGAIERLGRVFG